MISVTPLDYHPPKGIDSSYHYSGEPVYGDILSAGPTTVMLDGVIVLRRVPDEDAMYSGLPHPWEQPNGSRYTGYAVMVDVQPEPEDEP